MPDWPAETIAIMLQTHIAEYGPLPDHLGNVARAAVAGDREALITLAIALAVRERGDTE